MATYILKIPFMFLSEWVMEQGCLDRVKETHLNYNDRPI